MPNDAELQLVHGHALKTIGNVDAAINAYRKSFEAKNDYGDAYWSLANLKTYNFKTSEVKLMQEKEASPTIITTDRIHICFALGKHYEDKKQFKQSFEYYERGNSLQRSQQHYKKEQITDILALQHKYCNQTLFDKQKDMGCTAPDPIFIVGLPRAGSTLLEQILASHSKVDGTLELPNIPALAYRLAGRKTIDETPDYPENLATLNEEQLKTFGNNFLDDTRIHREKAPYFIDKMPNNFRHIALIHLILPNAKIIDARRNPMACCFSGFKQLFASGQQFSYGLEEIGTYYKDYISFCNKINKMKNLRLEGLSVHIGSQITSIQPFKKVLSIINKIISNTNINFKFIDLGGGMGISYSKKDKKLNLNLYAKFVEKFAKNKKSKIIFEPGRFIAGNSSVLISKIIYIKKNNNKTFIILDAGMNDLMRPALYNAHHEIIPIKKNKKKIIGKVEFVGPICESTDKFLTQKNFSRVNEGDYIAITNVGAYGMSLASNYNTRPIISEIMVSGSKYKMIKKRQSLKNLINN